MPIFWTKLDLTQTYLELDEEEEGMEQHGVEQDLVDVDDPLVLLHDDLLAYEPWNLHVE